jgi:hypothetical protein
MREFISLPLATAVALALTLASPTLSAGQYNYKVLHAFTGGSDGGGPASGFTLDTHGNPYGMTYEGGNDNDCPYQQGCGVIFGLSPNTQGKWKESVLLNLTKDTGGGWYYTNLLFDFAGNLFGSTHPVEIGSPAYIFELSPATGQLTPKGGQWNFDPIYDGGGCLVFDHAGNLYGCIGAGKYDDGAFGGLSPGSDGWTYTDLYNFCPPPNGCNGSEPQAPLTWDTHGNLYGTMLLGGNGPPKCRGSGGCGLAFQLASNGDGTWTYNILHTFAAFKTDGYYPYAGLTVDVSGNAYGLTSAGGKFGNGTFFELTPTENGEWKETILYQFPNCANGCGPSFTLVADQAGNLYSSGAGGQDCGGYSCGTVFKFSPQKDGAWKYSVIHKFTGADGAFPYGVVLDRQGNLFGATNAGGEHNMGVVFELSTIPSPQ